MNFKNMKIKVENNLDEIVGRLERLGYKKHIWEHLINTEYVVAFESGIYTNADFNPVNEIYALTTLAELKEM